VVQVPGQARYDFYLVTSFGQLFDDPRYHQARGSNVGSEVRCQDDELQRAVPNA
jgi:hypothetical protein